MWGFTLLNNFQKRRHSWYGCFRPLSGFYSSKRKCTLNYTEKCMKFPSPYGVLLFQTISDYILDTYFVLLLSPYRVLLFQTGYIGVDGVEYASCRPLSGFYSSKPLYRFVFKFVEQVAIPFRGSTLPNMIAEHTFLNQDKIAVPLRGSTLPNKKLRANHNWGKVAVPFRGSTLPNR